MSFRRPGWKVAVVFGSLVLIGLILALRVTPQRHKTADNARATSKNIQGTNLPSSPGASGSPLALGSRAAPSSPPTQAAGTGHPGPATPKDLRSEVVLALATRPASVARTARYSVATYFTSQGPPRSIASGEGTADFRRNEYLVAISGIRPGGGQETTLTAVIGDKEYYRPKDGGQSSWRPTRLNVEEVPMVVPDIELLKRTPWPRSTTDLAERKQVFDAIVAGIDSLGDETLRSRPTRHLRVHLDRDAGALKLPQALAAMAGRGSGDIELWIDGSGRLSKLSQLGPELGFAYELWDFDAFPKVDLPAGLPQT